ncbi:MFS transporter [Niveispirillum sp. KHB5.9]|uniref:MFS transporter n=1 Tax=Niveispirillum sp. KHB5.9 TaxID=3400269 RepID=UPI003A89BC65
MRNGRAILAVALTYIVFAMLLNSVGTVILQSIQSFGVTKLEAGRLEAYKDLPIAITSFIIASFLPRVGYRRAMIIVLVLEGVAAALMPILSAFWAMKLMFFCVGVGFAGAKVAVYSSIGLLTRDKQGHASLTNLIEGLFMVGVLGGYWLFSLFVDHDNPADPSWLNVYWLLSALSLTAAALWAVTPLDETGAHAPDAKPGIRQMARLAVTPIAVVFLASAFLYVLIEQAIGTWLPTFNAEVLHLPAAMSIQATSIFAACIALGRLGAGAALARIGWFPFLAACLAAMAALVLLTLPLAAGALPMAEANWFAAPIAAFMLPLIGLFMAPIYPVINSVILSALPRHDHAAMTGLIVVFSALGGTFGSFVTGFLFDRLGGQTAFYMALIPMGAIAVTLFLLNRRTAQA